MAKDFANLASGVQGSKQQFCRYFCKTITDLIQDPTINSNSRQKDKVHIYSLCPFGGAITARKAEAQKKEKHNSSSCAEGLKAIRR